MTDDDLTSSAPPPIAREAEEEEEEELVADEPKDLGFGSVVGGANERRLIERDGQFTAHREGFSPLSYLNGYHAMLTMTWLKFMGILTLAYVGLNALFAALYLPRERLGSAEQVQCSKQRIQSHVGQRENAHELQPRHGEHGVVAVQIRQR